VSKTPLSYLRLGLSLGLAASLIGCSLTSKKPEDVKVSIPNEAWWTQAANGNDINLANLAKVRQQMNRVSPAPYTLGITQQTQVNAFATEKTGQPLVVFTKGFLDQFGNDPDILATTLGHEIAHHKLGHTNQERQKNRALAQEASSRILSIVSSIFIPFSGFIVGPSVSAMGLSFNRDDEREADQLGMLWALQAGYSPCGSYRLSEGMAKLGKENSLAFLTTHPGSSERSENAQNFMVENKLPECK
jgi:predicted Zn-dependent protease